MVLIGQVIEKRHVLRTISAWPTENNKIYTIYLIENLTKYMYLAKIKRKERKQNARFVFFLLSMH